MTGWTGGSAAPGPRRIPLAAFWRAGLALLLSLFLLSSARAQTGDTNEDLAAGPAAEATAAELQAAYETRLTALFDQARRKGKVQVIVQLRMPFRPEAVLV